MLWSTRLWEGICIWCTIFVDGLVCFQTLFSPKKRSESQYPNKSVSDKKISYDLWCALIPTPTLILKPVFIPTSIIYCAILCETPFLLIENWGSERLSNFPKPTDIVQLDGRLRTQTQLQLTLKPQFSSKTLFFFPLCYGEKMNTRTHTNMHTHAHTHMHTHVHTKLELNS